MSRFQRLLKITFVLLALTGVTACAAVQVPVNYAAPLAGEVVGIAPGTVVYGIRAALAQHAGTFILAEGENLLFVWCYEGCGSAGFWGVNTRTLATVDAGSLLRGNLASAKTVSGLIDCLRQKGWADVAPGAVPAALAELVGARLALAPVMLFSVGAFPDGDFEGWMQDTFEAAEEQL